MHGMGLHCIAVKQFYLRLELKNKKALELQRLKRKIDFLFTLHANSECKLSLHVLHVPLAPTNPAADGILKGSFFRS